MRNFHYSSGNSHLRGRVHSNPYRRPIYTAIEAQREAAKKIEARKEADEAVSR
jgi:hypothetical protein